MSESALDLLGTVRPIRTKQVYPPFLKPRPARGTELGFFHGNAVGKPFRNAQHLRYDVVAAAHVNVAIDAQPFALYVSGIV